MKVYLAGPINGCTDDEATGWRSEAKKTLTNVLDPMDRDYRGVEDQNVRDIVMGDLDDIRSCDAVLAYCPRPSWGTAMEIVLASWNMQKPVIAVVPEGSVSPWLRYFTRAIVPTVEDGIKALLSL